MFLLSSLTADPSTKSLASSETLNQLRSIVSVENQAKPHLLRFVSGFVNSNKHVSRYLLKKSMLQSIITFLHCLAFVALRVPLQNSLTFQYQQLPLFPVNVSALVVAPLTLNKVECIRRKLKLNEVVSLVRTQCQKAVYNAQIVKIR